MSLAAKVLLVDDDTSLRSALAIRLRRAFDVLQAENASEALEALEADRSISALCTDIDMPGELDGLQLAAIVSRRWPQVAISVHSGGHAEILELPLGAEYFEKTKDTSALVRNLLSHAALSPRRPADREFQASQTGRHVQSSPLRW